MGKTYKIGLFETITINDKPITVNILGEFYTKELERVLAPKPSLRKAIMGSVFIERFVILLASKRDKKVLDMKDKAYAASIKITKTHKLLSEDQIELIREYRRKRNWILHDIVSNTKMERKAVEKKLSEMCDEARDIIEFLQDRIV